MLCIQHRTVPSRGWGDADEKVFCRKQAMASCHTYGRAPDRNAGHACAVSRTVTSQNEWNFLGVAQPSRFAVFVCETAENAHMAPHASNDGFTQTVQGPLAQFVSRLRTLCKSVDREHAFVSRRD